MKKIPLIFTCFLICSLVFSANAAQYLVPGGQVIGMQLQDDTVTIAAVDPAFPAAAQVLREGDRLLRIDHTQIRCAQDVRDALDKSRGPVSLTLQRGEKTKHLRLTPSVTEEGPKLGIYLKEGTTGVGTVTYYDAQDHSFAALGHGVNSKNGSLIRLTQGSIYPASVKGVKKGTAGKPGQLMGALTDGQAAGSIAKNTAQGVFGTLDSPAPAPAILTAESSQIHTGPATIRSTVEGTALQEYSVEILKIYPSSPDRTRNMLIRVTDPALLEATGGIVQGMSGSPIIQDGRLIGAVTHVLINDPTTGYGIFIENMLDAAA